MSERVKPLPQHGTYARHSAGCRCLPCKSARADYQRVWIAGKKRGHRRMVDATRAREHLLALQQQGLGYKQVAEIGKMGDQTIRWIRKGGRTKITVATEQKILAITASRDVMPDHALVDAAPTRKRIRELISRGWEPDWIARQIGLPCGKIQFRYRRVTVRNAARVERLYEAIDAGKVRRA